MTAFDYSRPLATAQRLVARFGRLVALQGVSAGPADPNDPLAGPAPAPDPIEGIRAAFVEPSGLRALGLSINVRTLFKECSEIALVAPITGAAGEFDDMKFLIDNDASVWKINAIEVLRPADLALLYFIGVVRP